MSVLQNNLDAQIEYLKSNGGKVISMEMLKSLLQEIGYRIDMNMACYFTGRYMSGVEEEHLSRSWPAMTVNFKQIDDGKSFAHVDARRDENFKLLQKMRFDEPYIVVHKKSILSM